MFRHPWAISPGQWRPSGIRNTPPFAVDSFRDEGSPNHRGAEQRVATDKVRKEWPFRLPLAGPVVEGGPCG